MDTSSIYRKMCARAREIQEHHWAEGDYYFDNLVGSIGVMSLDDCLAATDPQCPEYCPDYYRDNQIWLPRLDQLQEMFFIDYESFLEDMPWLVEIMNKDDYDSAEQFLLTVIMRYKRHKAFDGKDWFKIEVNNDEELFDLSKQIFRDANHLAHLIRMKAPDIIIENWMRILTEKGKQWKSGCLI